LRSVLVATSMIFLSSFALAETDIDDDLLKLWQLVDVLNVPALSAVPW
jgi:hypothetical protein